MPENDDAAVVAGGDASPPAPDNDPTGELWSLAARLARTGGSYGGRTCPGGLSGVAQRLCERNGVDWARLPVEPEGTP